MEPLQLKIGMEASMECPSASGKKAKSMVRGWRENEYILMDIPKFSFPFPVNTYLKEVWVVRFIRQGKVVGFKVNGLESFPAYDLFLLEFPKDIEVHSLRKQLRANLSLPVLLSSNSEEGIKLPSRGMSMDISLGGMRLKVPDELDASRPYFISFYLPTGESFKDVECQALKMEGAAQGWVARMRFSALSDQQKRALEACLLQFFDKEEDGE